MSNKKQKMAFFNSLMRNAKQLFKNPKDFDRAVNLSLSYVNEGNGVYEVKATLDVVGFLPQESRKLIRDYLDNEADKGFSVDLPNMN